MLLKVASPVAGEIDGQSCYRRNRENDADAGDDELARERERTVIVQLFGNQWTGVK